MSSVVRFRLEAAAVAAALLLFCVAMVLPAQSEASFEKVPGATSAPADPGPSGDLYAGKASPYIVGGSETTFDKHPWLVQITFNGGAFCGGALVHPMLVLTAAHCIWSGQAGTRWSNLGVVQAFTSRTLSETGGEQLQLASSGFAQNYQPLDAGGTGENDYGFFALASPSSRPLLKIAGPGETALWTAGRTASVAGFGNISQGGSASPVLKELSVPLISDAFCGSGASYGTAFNPSNMLCAGIVQGGSGTCQGDSGGPLTVPIDGGGRRIVGVVSWGDGCAKPNKPTVYARVAAPAVSTQINALAAEAAQLLNFPGVHADSNVLGSGAKPAGCAAAQSAATQAKAAVTKANKAVANTKKAVTKAKAKVKKAKGQAKVKAQKALKKANQKAKKAKSNLSKAKANLKSANAKAKSAC